MWKFKATRLQLWGIFPQKVSDLHPNSTLLTRQVGDYAIFIKKWADPHGGIHGYLHRFLESNDPTFQHIAIWTLLQLLESEDRKLVTKIQRASDITKMVRGIAERSIESDDEDNEDKEGEMEVISLARRCVELMDQGGSGKKSSPSSRRDEPRGTLMEG
jgi:hypothetical protein